MLSIITCLFGIFVGLTTSWYFQIKPISEKDHLIQQQRYKLRKIKIAVSKQQYGSVENLQNKIKSILSNDDQSENSTL